VSSTASFEFGIEGLDQLYPGVLTPGTLLVIAGHPGTGKTSMAAQLCYANALKGRRCLYISTQETEEKFMRFMKRFGFDFEYVTSTGHFRFSRLPLISSEEAVDSVLESITSMVLEFKPEILVVDSITPLTKVITGDVKRRALLQNYFYNIAFDIKGVVILIAEIPLGKTTIEEAGDIEFVADGIIILRHELRNGVVARRMEVRKLRGAPLEVSEVPFTITAGRGIVALAPPRYEVERRGESRRRFNTLCKPLEETIGELMGGEVVLVAGTPYSLTMGRVLEWITRIAYESKAGLTVISYRGLESDILGVLEGIKSREPELAGVVENATVASLSPAILSPEALISLELEHLSRSKPDIAVIMGVDALKHVYKLSPLLVERLLDVEKQVIRRLGILTFKISYITSLDDISWELPRSDVTIIVGDPVTGVAGGNVIARRMGGGELVGPRELLKECF
jgi:circadian clock protein KaiC